MARKDIQEILAALSVRPAKDLGQNFLCDGNVAKKSVSMAQVVPGELVVEIGPGLGALTEQLLATGAEVHAVELDGRLCEFLRNGLVKRFPGKFFLLHGDAVAFPRGDVAAEDKTTYAVVANLPYAITSPWLDAILKLPLPKSMVLLTQLESAERLLAPPRSRRRGAIGVRIGAAFRMISMHKIPPQCFHPRPKVQSALVHMQLLDEPLVFSQKPLAIMRHCFQFRRKQLATSCRAIENHGEKLLAERWLHLGTVDPHLRPEDLELSHWRSLQQLNCEHWPTEV
ncbi:MAG: 16S rRNA (adenine(1518)-N(6)/adenine(1519)-N(6))-dimethyltransferase RsmA [Puniceicoccales bacterium]|jgi:16S rRNA (adenine1518-N6/adenine1519-N6)-dimethyltransferase|nr:16S rRNA (adenine(1518)-N(6)/adenine(1519)-N(6))-dimethyltransferase RsmA [Puniceicoccales bacterium]